MRSFILVAIVVVLLAGCAKPEKHQMLFPIDSVVNAQLQYLQKSKAALVKTVLLDQEQKQVSYTPDSIGWIKELDVFHQLDVLNKPVSQSSYLVDDGLYDPGSNLTVKAFTSLDEDLPVQSVRVFYQSSIDRPRKIEAVLKERTSLYKSARFMTMIFQQVDNKTVLTSYSVEGGQQMALGDSIAFSVKGNIQYQ
jgi:hypothetical protein